MSAEQEKRFHELQAKNQKVMESAIRINAQIEHAQAELDKRKEAAQKKFGESDLDKLKQMAAQWRSENQKALDDYEAQLNEMEAEVKSKEALIRQIQSGAEA